MISAIVLAAGSGKRMGGNVPKQYMDLLGRPLIFYALNAFENSAVDEIVLVVAKGEIEYCKKEIVDRYHFAKVTHIVEGGAERYLSVNEGLQAVSGQYVLIHDGARAFVDDAIINRSIEAAKEYKAAVIGMPSKDTVKIADEEGYVSSTPARKLVWNIQTPQCFETKLIKEAYSRIIASGRSDITDDAMVVEATMDVKVKLVEGSYENIKVTTPEDIAIGQSILKRRVDKVEKS